MVDIKIDLIGFDPTGLDLPMEAEPGRVFIDFSNIAEISQREFSKLVQIYNRFPKPSLFFINIVPFVKEQLQFLLMRDAKIRVLDETKTS